jgi:hypothetical protein
MRKHRGALLTLTLLLGVAAVLSHAAAELQSKGSGDEISEPLSSVEIVVKSPCFSGKMLSSLILRTMQVSQGRVFRGSGATDKPHIRWVIENLPDAGGTIRSIGPPGNTYKQSPFWRHPVSVQIQWVVKSKVLKEIGAL